MNANVNAKASTAFHEAAGRVIRQLRVAAALTQPEAAQRAGITHTMWSRAEHGYSRLPLSTVARIAKVFDLRSSDLLTRIETEWEASKPPSNVVPDNDA